MIRSVSDPSGQTRLLLLLLPVSFNQQRIANYRCEDETPWYPSPSVLTICP
jgi:hypothetical protein